MSMCGRRSSAFAWGSFLGLAFVGVYGGLSDSVHALHFDICRSLRGA